MRGTRPALAIVGALAACFAAAGEVAAFGPGSGVGRFAAAIDAGGGVVSRVKTCTFTPNSLQPLPCQEDDTADAGDGGGTGSGGDGTQGGGTAAPQRTFAYYPPGLMHPSDSREGRIGDRRVYLPDIAFPISLEPAQHPHLNSQIFGYGGGGWGGNGAPGGTECDTRNYDPFTQRDNFCEVRSWPMPFCPSGSGHQGQDIRPPTCANARWLAVAVDNGTITRVTNYTTVILKADDGTNYYYLHLSGNGMKVSVGQRVEKGDPIGTVSNIMGGRRGTTIHLHFAARQTVEVDGKTQNVYVPVYTSLIAALRRAKGLGPSVDQDGNLIVDANYEIGAAPVVVPPPTPGPGPVPQPGPGDSGTPETPPATGDADTLAEAREQIAELQSQLNELKVQSERAIADAEGQANDAKVALQQSRADLKQAQDRIDALEAQVASEREAAEARQAALKAEMDQTAVTLAQVRAELDALKAEQAESGIWQRTKKWVQSLWQSAQ